MLDSSKLFDIGRDIFSKISQILAGKNHALLPIRYFFELTHRCNMNCPYCYLGKERISQDKELSTDDWLDIIEQIPFYSLVTIVGGEPLLREDFREIFKAVSKKTMYKTHLVTNGLLLNDNIIENLIDNKLKLLSVSLDGFKDTHDKLRNHKGAFNIITQNLDNLYCSCKAQNANIMVDIKTIVLKDNLEDILKLYEYATNKGFEFFSISFLRNNNLKQNPILKDSFGKEFYSEKYPIELYFNMDEFEKIYSEIQKIKKYSKTKIRFAPKFEHENSKIELQTIKDFFTKNKDKSNKEIYYPCKYPWSNTIINPMGDIYPCLSYKMGNIKEQSLKEIINSKNYCTFRQNLSNHKVFSSCSMCCELKVK